MIQPRLLLFGVALLAGCGTSYDQKPSSPKKTEPQSADSGSMHHQKLVLSKETTYFTEPLCPDGSVDYVAAFNKRLSAGVTPENNALIPILRATGPRPINEKVREKYFQALGIPAPPVDGTCLIFATDLPEYKEAEKQSGDANFLQSIWAQYDKAVKTPWSKKEYPLWAIAIERDNKLLDAVVEGLRRPKAFSPLVPEDEPPMLIASVSIEKDSLRQVMRLLPLRAMFKLGHGDVDGAWQDVMAQYRLQRLWSHQPSLINRLVLAAGCRFPPAIAISRYDRLASEQALKIPATIPQFAGDAFASGAVRRLGSLRVYRVHNDIGQAR